MKSFKTLRVLLALVFTFFAVTGNASAGTFDIAVTAAGDATYHTQSHSVQYWATGETTITPYCWGYNYYPWEWDRDTGYMQYSLSDILEIAPADILSVYIYLYVESIYIGDWGSGVGAGNLNHASNSSSATGDATQGIGGDQWVGLISTQPLGWVSFDVTDYIKADLTSGYAYAAFSLNYTFNGEGSSGMTFTAAEGGANASYLRINNAMPTYTYYAGGRLESKTMVVADADGNMYCHYLDEDWQGQGYGRMDKQILGEADEDGAISFEYSYPESTQIVAADLDGDGAKDLAIDFGGQGFYKYTNNSTYTKIGTARPKDIAVADLDEDGKEDLVLNYSEYGLWKYVDNGSSFTRMGTASPESIAAADLDGSGKKGDLIINYGTQYGLWKYTGGTTLTQIGTASPKGVTVADLDGNGKDDVVLNYADYGLWKYMNDGASFTQIGTASPEMVIAADLDGSGKKDDLVIDYGTTYGLWKYVSGTLTQLGTASPKDITVADLDGNGKDDIVLNYADYGLWKYVNGGESFTQIGTASPEMLEAADLDGSGKKDDLIIDYGTTYGLWQYIAGTTLTNIGTASPESITVADLDANGKDDVVLDYGIYGIYEYMNGTTLINIATLNSDRRTVKKGYSAEDYTGLVTTCEYDAAGDLVSKTYSNVTEKYGDDLIKRFKEAATLDIYEYNDEDFAEQGYGRIILIYDSSEGTYQTYAWDDKMEQVTVGLYTGAYEPSFGSSEWSDVQSGEKLETFVYDHKGEQVDLDTETNGWVIREHTVLDGPGGSMATHDVFNAAGQMIFGENAAGEKIEYFDDGLEKRTNDGAGTICEYMDENFDPGSGPIGYGRTILITHPFEGTYQTWTWNDETSQVTVNTYFGTYEPSDLSANLSDVQSGELTETLVYDHHGEQLNLGDSSWVLREHTMYYSAGASMQYRYVYDPDGQMIRSEDADSGTATTYTYFEGTERYSLKEAYELNTDAWLTSEWFYNDEDNRLWQKAEYNDETLGVDAYEYYNVDGYVMKTAWDSDSGHTYGYDTDGSRLLWEQYDSDYDGSIDSMKTFDYYVDPSEQYEWVNEYTWSEGDSFWIAGTSHHYDTEGNYEGSTIRGLDPEATIGMPEKPEHVLREMEYYNGNGNIKTYKDSYSGIVYTYEDYDFFGFTYLEGEDRGFGRVIRMDYPNGDFYALDYWDQNSMSVKTMEKRQTNEAVVTTGFKVYQNETFYDMPNMAYDHNEGYYEAVGTVIPGESGGFKVLVGVYYPDDIVEGPYWLKTLSYNVGINTVAVEMDSDDNVIVAASEWNDEAGATGAMGLRLSLLSIEDGSEIATTWWNGINEEAPLDLSINDVFYDTNSGNIFVVGNYGSYPNYQACVAVFTPDGMGGFTCDDSLLIGEPLSNTQGYELEMNEEGDLIVHGTVQSEGSDTQAYFWEYNSEASLVDEGYDTQERTHDGWWLGACSTGRIYVDNGDNGEGDEMYVTPAYVPGTGVPLIEYSSSGDMQEDHGNMLNFCYYQDVPELDLGQWTGCRGIFDDGMVVEVRSYGPDDERPTKAILLDGRVDWFLWNVTYNTVEGQNIAIENAADGSWAAYVLSEEINSPVDLFNRENWTLTTWDTSYSQEDLPEFGAWPQSGLTAEYASEVPNLYYDSGLPMTVGQPSGLFSYIEEDWNGSGYGRIKSVCRPGGEGSGPSYSLYGYFGSSTDRLSYDYSFMYGAEDSLLYYYYSTFYNESFYGGAYNSDGISQNYGYGRQYGYMDGSTTIDDNEKQYAYAFNTEKVLIRYEANMSQVLGGGNTYLFYNKSEGSLTDPYAVKVEFGDSEGPNGAVADLVLIGEDQQQMVKLDCTSYSSEEYPEMSGNTFWFLWGDVDWGGDTYTNVVIAQIGGPEGPYVAWYGFTADTSNPDNVMNMAVWTPMNGGDPVDPGDFSRPLPEMGSWWQWAQDQDVMVEFPALYSMVNNDEYDRPIEKIDHNDMYDTRYLMTWDTGPEGFETSEMTLDIWYDFNRDGNWDQQVFTGTYGNNGDYDMSHFASWGAPLTHTFSYTGGPESLRTDAPEILSGSGDIALSDDVAAFMAGVDTLKGGATGEGVSVALLDVWGSGEEHGDDTYNVLAATASGADISKLDISDPAGRITATALAEAIRSAVDLGAKVLVMPIGMSLVSGNIIDSIDYASGKGSILITAAGNDAGEILDSSLAAQDKVITVGSVDNDGNISAWSNTGSEVDLYAPWDVIENGKGTSFSAAFVAGIAALVLEEHPEFTAGDVLGALKAMLPAVKTDLRTTQNAELTTIKGVSADEVLSLQDALKKQKEEFTGTSPKVEGMADPITQ